MMLTPSSDLAIVRHSYSPLGTFGTLSLDDSTFVSIERPWLHNLPNVSCIPEGRYTCKPRFYYRGGYDAVEVTAVPGRSHILFHIANCPLTELQGCIAVCSKLGVINGQWGGLSSRRAFKRFMALFGGRTFQLEIRGLRIDQQWENRSSDSTTS